MFKDPFNPSEDEIRGWAYDTKASEPQEDWDLFIADLKYEDLLLKLSTDDHCPKRRYFLHVLYLIVGDAVRTNYQKQNKYSIDAFLEQASKVNHHDISSLLERSHNLIQHPEKFDYGDWCSGSLAGFDWKTI